MSAPIRKKPVTRRSAAKIASSDPNDLKARFEAVTGEIAADLRAVTDEITNAVMDAVAASSESGDSLRKSVFMVVSLKVLENFFQGLSDRMSSSDVGSNHPFSTLESSWPSFRSETSEPE